MKLIKVKDYDTLSDKATEMVLQTIRENEQPILGLATGSTPMKLYENLIHLYKNGDISFQNVLTYNLDEYVGLPPDHIGSYHYFMHEKLFDHIDIPLEQVYLPNGASNNPEAVCDDLEASLKKTGTIDLQVLGIGMNGHIGFNEPGTPFHSRSHVIKLEESTRQVNSRFFDKLADVPTHAITMGLATIMEAKEIVLLVQGEKKADILREVVYGEVTEDVPGSVLKLHPNATIITDIDL